jgi:hypothetical protein
MNLKNSDPDLEKMEKDMKRKRWIPKLAPVDTEPLDDETACHLLKAYFNNKMTVILLMLQTKRPRTDSLASLKAVIFLEDLYHHMLRKNGQERFERVFQWLRLFFKRFPYVKPVQKRKAIEYIQVVYRLFGMGLELNI